MLKPQVHKSHTRKPFLAWQKPFISGDGGALSFPVFCKPISEKTQKNIRIRHSSRTIKAIADASTAKVTSVKAIVTVHSTVSQNLSNLGLSRGLDDISDLLGKTLLLQLVAAELDPKTGLEKATIKGFAHRKGSYDEEVEYECDFEIPNHFGEVGAVLVENEHHKEMYLKKIVLDGFPLGPVTLTCNSWVHSKYDDPDKRLFFTNKVFF